MEIRKAPHSTKYDGRFLLVVENWIILLTRYSSLEYDTPSPENPWPFALTRLNYLIKRCQKILFDSEEWYYMDDRFEDPRPELLSPWAQPAIENEVEMARLVIGELLLSKFGSWLADINQRNIWNFGNGRPFYNVDYDNMDLEFVTFGPGGIIYHIRSYLEIGLLFLDERTKELSGYSMRNMNERPFIAFGIGGDGHDQYLFQDDDDDYDDFDDDDDESYTLGNDSDRDDNDGDSKSNIATNGGSSGNSDSDMSFFELNDMQRSNASGITPEELDKSGSPGMIDPGATKPLTRLEIESMNLRFAELENRMLRLELRVEHTTRMCDQFAIFSGDMIEVHGETYDLPLVNTGSKANT
ncbi:hypothetical protein GGR51DRAFT_544292 [Nemania sp. FL0031]|nr:hypothetical protein GGR51DRAFT_544292 [Nemania sp. FL0031]